MNRRQAALKEGVPADALQKLVELAWLKLEPFEDGTPLKKALI
jgi:hypothetical protein